LPGIMPVCESGAGAVGPEVYLAECSRRWHTREAHARHRFDRRMSSHRRRALF